MSLLSSWGGKESRGGSEEELSVAKISTMAPIEQSRILFESIRGTVLDLLSLSILNNIIQ